MQNALSQQIASDLQRFGAAWKTNDGASLGKFFVEDGTLINPFGQRADGRSAVSAMYAEYFGGMLSGSSTRFEVSSARALPNEHAFVDARQIIVGADGGTLLEVHLAAVLRREGDGWRFVDARPYSYASLPG